MNNKPIEPIKCGLINYYGDVEAWEDNGEFFMELEDHSSFCRIKISEAFFRAYEKEFKDKIPQFVD